MLALLAWQSSTIAQDERRSTILADLALILTTSALLLTHIFGAFVWAALAVAEAVNIWEVRRFNFSRALAVLLPLAVTWTWIPLFRLHTQASYPPAFQAHLSQIVPYYAERLSRECIALVCTGIFLAILSGRQYLRRAASFAFTGAELTAAFVIAASPILLIARLAAGHAAFFYRYGDICLVGFAIVIPAAVLRLTGNRSTPAVLAAIIVLMVSSRWQHAVTFAAKGQIFRHTEPPLIPYHPETVASKNLPIVINSGIVFVEMNNHEPPSTLARTYYLTGGPIALRYTHASIFEGTPKVIAAFHLSGRSEPYLSFVREHHEFYLLASDHDFPEDWLLRKLHDDGATLTLAGHVENNYRDHNIYDVTMPSLR
jgi:hypothetical protein